jgi:MscS family membrane protein
MIESIQSFFAPAPDWEWLTLQVLVTCGLTISLNFVFMRIIDALEHLTRKTSSLWDDDFLEALRLPLRLFIWTLGITASAYWIELSTDTLLFKHLPEIRRVAYIAIGAMFFHRLVRMTEAHLIDPKRMNKPMDTTTARAVGNVARISIVVLAGLIILQTLGYSVSGILAFGGIGGIAVGFAAKDLLANFFGGLMLYLDKPFAVGDTVRSPDREIEGTIEDIGWRITRIRNLERRPVYIPNSMFSNIAVENITRMSHRRINEWLGIRYEDLSKVTAIVDSLTTMLKQHPSVDTEEPMIVQLDKLGDFSVQIRMMCHVAETSLAYFDVKQDILLKAVDIIHAHGADFAFPTQTLHVERSVP